ncbi:MAG: hypothetical protein BMS9Abin12_1061 [Acidimicrobiia bacterium]|nr:MAG: hypothetical protein BMS9Abin12_1061 [Acidimicrobiia bacterium]
MADRPRDDDWWLASDGRWYPPDLGPDADAVSLPEQQGSASSISPAFTLVTTIALSITSAILAGAAYAGLRYASALQKFSGELSESEKDALASVELTWASWTALALLTLILTGVLVIGWTYSISRSLDSRSPIGRRWRGGWTIGAWLIPIANLVLPKLMLNEIEKIAQVPYAGVPVGEEWRRYSRSQLGDLWWLLWLGGVVPSQMVQLVIGNPAEDAGRLAIMVNITAFTYVMFAGAGIALALLVRRIESSSRA